jgi:choline dehydrogenase
MDRKYDVIVVGAGSAGCVVAGVLARQTKRKILLLEAGSAAEDNPETLRADGYKDAFVNDDLIWERFSQPQQHCAGNRLFMGSGRGMGGSGSVNGMVYTRGCAADFAEWPTGWRWPDLAPDFDRLEQQLRIRRREPNAFTEACIAAATQVGFREKTDLNDGDLDGVIGYEWMNYEGDRRRSSYAAFLEGRPPNLEICTGARAYGVRFKPTKRVAGVEFEHQGRREFAAATEVVLCAGALETPKLLMLSGIGPSDLLRRHSIPVLLDQPQVGQNFHDHPNVTLFFLGKKPVDCNYPQLYGFHRANHLTALPWEQPDTCYVFYPARSSLKEAMKRLLPGMILPPALATSRPAKALVRGTVELTLSRKLATRLIERIYGIVVILGKPASRGTVRIGSADPRSLPLIDPSYFTEPEDLETMIEGVRFAQRIGRAPALVSFGNRALSPSPFAWSQEHLAQWIKTRAMTTYHYAGTCRLGDDEGSVVDSRLAVRGVSGLRIADASVIPTTPVSAINATSMLIGYRAARFIEEESRDHVRAA